MDNISPEDQETIREFLVESHENLSRLDQDLVELEKHPRDADLLGSIFRTIHTIKGACGFLAFSVLEAITHQAETLLSLVWGNGLIRLIGLLPGADVIAHSVFLEVVENAGKAAWVLHHGVY